MPTPSPQKPLRAYAKINLGLMVMGRRPDGYHDIATIFHRIDLFDEITLSAAADIRVDSTDPAAPGDSSNTCFTAARLLQERLGETAGVRCRVSKRIPVGAGLGGGSSDAATLLCGLPALWGRAVDGATLRDLAIAVGSDVPYFLSSGSAFATGRGEILEYFALDLPFAICVCYPNVPVATSWAYAQVQPRSGSSGDLRSALEEGIQTPALLQGSLVNDFEDAVTARYPEIAQVKASFRTSGSVFASMSGTGSSVYGFFPDLQTALDAARACRARGYRAFVTPPGFTA